MSAEQKLMSQMALSSHTIERAPHAPSEFLRQREADLLADLTRMAHREGKWFTDRPRLTLIPDTGPGFGRDLFHLRAEATVA